MVINRIRFRTPILIAFIYIHTVFVKKNVDRLKLFFPFLFAIVANNIEKISSPGEIRNATSMFLMRFFFLGVVRFNKKNTHITIITVNLVKIFLTTGGRK